MTETLVKISTREYTMGVLSVPYTNLVIIVINVYAIIRMFSNSVNFNVSQNWRI